MKKALITAVALLVIPATSFSDESDLHYRALVDEVLEVTGALQIGQQMSDLFVMHMVQAMKAGGTELPDRALELLEDEVRSTIRAEIESGSFAELMYPIYAKHLNANDLEAALAFYRTPEGKKMVEAMPAMAAESMVVGQKWGESLGPKVAERVRVRLAEEGIELP